MPTHTSTTRYKVTSGDLEFESPAGVITLTQIIAAIGGTMSKWIKVTGQAPGNLTLNDGTNWGINYSFISGIQVETSSTNWDLWLCEDNTFTTSAQESRLLASGRGSGKTDLTVLREYNPGDANVYLKYIDNDAGGPYNADFYITGAERSH